CRSAFKLLEVQEKQKILKPGQVVIDCGAAPGAWSQVACSLTNSDASEANPIQLHFQKLPWVKRSIESVRSFSVPKAPVGKVISIDLTPLYPIEGVTLVCPADFTSAEVQGRIEGLLDGRCIDVVLSDMSPKASGLQSLDQDAIDILARSAMAFAIKNKAEIFLCKLFASPGNAAIKQELVPFFETVQFIKPEASRKESYELFLLAKNRKKDN
ncbi:unnamed protein product, partial [Cyprideis torosa]